MASGRNDLTLEVSSTYTTYGVGAPTKAGSSGVEYLPKEMKNMKINDDKIDLSGDMELQASVVDGNGTETGHIIGVCNGQPKQTIHCSAECVVDSGLFGTTQDSMEQTACPPPANNVSHVQYLGEEAAPLFPLVEHCELPSISADVLKSILTEEQGYPAQSVVIIDSRHGFEYEGGHIKGAVNLRDPNAVEEFYSSYINVGKQITIVFHCEFSSSRAPKLFKHMRNLDRLAHLETYPELAFPNMFLLKGGYKAFFELYSELCMPRKYVKMSDPKFVDHLRVSTSSLKRSWNQKSKNFIDSHQEDCDGPLIDVSNVQQKARLTTTRICPISLPFSQQEL